MKHTPGPWIYETKRDANGNRRIYAPSAGYTICVPMSHEDDSMLISKAPQIVDALLDIESIIITSEIDSMSKELILNLIGKSVSGLT